eukprot:5195028-Amphidinium_carterae.1
MREPGGAPGGNKKFYPGNVAQSVDDRTGLVPSVRTKSQRSGLSACSKTWRAYGVPVSIARMSETASMLVGSWGAEAKRAGAGVGQATPAPTNCQSVGS